jgi:Uma2 family endonuclease
MTVSLAPHFYPYRFTHDEYLHFERASAERHEYLDGVIYALEGWQSIQAMAGESENHGMIAMNLAAALVPHLRGTPCRAFSKDMKVCCGSYTSDSRDGLYAYPDLVVVCGERQYHDQARDVLLNPTILIEVLSPSTASYDRGEKFHRYRTWLASLMDYVLVAQDTPAIEHYHRAAPDVWTLRTVTGLEASLQVETLSWTVSLAAVYDRVEFPERKDPHAEKTR